MVADPKGHAEYGRNLELSERLEIRPNPISFHLGSVIVVSERLLGFLETSLCVLLNNVCSPIVISCKTLYKTFKGFLEAK